MWSCWCQPPSAAPQSCGPRAPAGDVGEGEGVQPCQGAHPSPLGCALTLAHPGAGCKSLLALEEEGVMGLGQVRSGQAPPSPPSSSSATSFAGGSHGHGCQHSLKLKSCSSRKPEPFERSPFQPFLPFLRVLKTYFSSKQESQQCLVFPCPSHSRKRSCLASLADNLS